MAKNGPSTDTPTTRCRRHGHVMPGCPGHKGASSRHRTAADRRTAAAARKRARDGRTALEQLDLLDKRLGFGCGAKIERLRLKERLTKAEKAELARRGAEIASRMRRWSAEKAVIKA